MKSRLHRRRQSLTCLLLATVCSAPAAEPPCEAPPLRLAAGAGPGPIREPIEWSSDLLKGNVQGDTELSGAVSVRMGERTMRADRLVYDAVSNSVQLSGRVSYSDPAIQVEGDAGFYGDDGAQFRAARFELLQQPGRGAAQSIDLQPSGAVELRKVTYTTCPKGVADWQIQAGRITLDTHARRGVGRHARLDFKGVPILYIPYISFPLSDARQTGLLFPTVGNSSRSGAVITVPWYWNIAPQQDLTLEPTLYARRGVDIGVEYRLLTSAMRGTLDVNLLPHDRLTGTRRSYLQLRDRWQLPRGWRLDVDAADTSDAHYFEDFADGSQSSSVIFLARRAALSYRDDTWRFGADLRHYQTLDTALTPQERPYAEFPRLSASGRWRAARGLDLAFDGEFTGFTRSAGVGGWRTRLRPELGYQLARPGWHLRPAAAWDFTAYSLRHAGTGASDSPTRSLPVLSLDAGLSFERDSGSRAARRITLEPRLYYLYVPYRDQAAIPVFDTALPDTNVVSLFRANRYIGGDRVSDANEITLGLTTQAFSSRSGQRFLSATVGESFYLEAPQVTLPGEVPQARRRSALITDLDWRPWRAIGVRYVLAWDPQVSRTARSSVTLQYRRSGQQVANLSYRYLHGQMEQADASLAWPLGRRWDAYARGVYSLMDRKSIENFAGLQYRGSCWALRFVSRRSVSSRTGATDSGFYLQLELNGLSSVGTGADAFLERSIRGYSASTSRR
ncbi:MAG: LPS-assembly protein LptD [Gammaproteobacteria bacterium]|nr:LPS-assembly protein LptD [Gammaproteobacteria bacterium]